MTDKLHYYLESNDPILYRIKHKKNITTKIKAAPAILVMRASVGRAVLSGIEITIDNKLRGVLR